ncbi:hypothetical protein JSE7799_03008 [Jannaschia seosinensis]|uniref:YjiS-like domain-containing protein n=1 Tax=Jannaschia seosinensis TaxID=313367 RepID=A0A0M7BG16_9RHOB|nr:DUF1127 domain-containing protein [Jannaschia seosinensis]CUH40276.1 hypothetical protein JSE7799_03008 [Jannaschia seosinensis]
MASLALNNSALNLHVPLTASPAARMLVAAGETLAAWETRARTRAALRQIDPARLPDLGLTTAEALREAAKPFWRA